MAYGCAKAIAEKLQTQCLNSPEFAHELAKSHIEFGTLMWTTGRKKEGEYSFRQALELYQTPAADAAYVPLRVAYYPQVKWIEVLWRFKAANNLNNLAWYLATCPEPELLNSDLSVELAARAVELTPQDGNIWNTLGAAQYRAGDWNAAIDALGKSMELRHGGDALDWFFLSMTHWQLGAKDEARKWYNQSIEWMDTNQPNNEEMIRFRTEAAVLLGIASPQPSNEPSAPNK
jgi:tetratricopeptide (TPR) repeat protein